MPNELQVLRPSKGRSLLILGGSLAFILLSTWLLQERPHRALLWWSSIGLFGLCALVGLATLMPGASYLALDDEGFTMRMLWRRHRYEWNDFTGFLVCVMQTGTLPRRMVGFNFTPDSPRRPKSARLVAFNRKMIGCDAALPDSFGLTPEGLVQLLNERLAGWRLKQAIRGDVP